MLIENIYTAMTLLSEEHTTGTLGDRSEYLGASEVGTCPRKTCMNKLYPPRHDLATLLRFKRGHMAEDVMAEAFTKNGWKFERQVEVIKEFDGVPVQSHIDFVFPSEKTKSMKILEIKSPGNMPDYPYSSWDAQTHFQMGLLADANPDYQISAGILGVEFGKNAIKLWNGYKPDPTFFGGLIERAKKIWSYYQSLKHGEIYDSEVETEISALCMSCSFLETCPAFTGDKDEVFEPIANDYLLYKEEEKVAKERADLSKKVLSTMLERRGSDVRISGKVFRLSRCTRESWESSSLNDFFSSIDEDSARFKKVTSYFTLKVT